MTAPATLILFFLIGPGILSINLGTCRPLVKFFLANFQAYSCPPAALFCIFSIYSLGLKIPPPPPPSTSFLASAACRAAKVSRVCARFLGFTFHDNTKCVHVVCTYVYCLPEAPRCRFLEAKITHNTERDILDIAIPDSLNVTSKTYANLSNPGSNFE